MKCFYWLLWLISIIQQEGCVYSCLINRWDKAVRTFHKIESIDILICGYCKNIHWVYYTNLSRTFCLSGNWISILIVFKYIIFYTMKTYKIGSKIIFTYIVSMRQAYKILYVFDHLYGWCLLCLQQRLVLHIYHHAW